MKWLKAIHDAAKMNAHYERYMQDTVHGWDEPCEMPGENAERAPAWVRKLPLPVIHQYWLLRRWMERFYIAHLAAILWMEFKRIVVCGRRGHDFEDTGSWANGESGGEDMTCRRCGFHVHHTYY